jgi:hypothetical protein
MDATLVRYLESLDDEEYARDLNEICEGLAFVIERRNFARSANLAVAQLTPPAAPEGTRHWR